MWRMRNRLSVLTLLAPIAAADRAQILAVDVTNWGDSQQFSVTLHHSDTGWDDYADGWNIRAAQGSTLGFRLLTHPPCRRIAFYARALRYSENIPAGGIKSLWHQTDTSL
ncbi:MAG: hypothetical protein ACI8TF_002382 [Paracoccaceae bacterium]|jgi:hypothetical protein